MSFCLCVFLVVSFCCQESFELIAPVHDQAMRLEPSSLVEVDQRLPGREVSDANGDGGAYVHDGEGDANGDNQNVNIVYFIAGSGDSSTMSKSFRRAAGERTSPSTSPHLTTTDWNISRGED